VASSSAQDLGLYNDDTDLYSADRARNQPGADQATLGPIQHRQFAEATVGDNKAMAVPLALAIPAYTAAKALGVLKSRSPASMEEMKQGYKGIWRGLTK
jgi:hypothetical protein